MNAIQATPDGGNLTIRTRSTVLTEHERDHGGTLLLTRLLLLFLVESQKTYSSNFAHLKSNSWNISNGVTTSSETRDQNFVVLINIVQATISWDESSNLLSVLDQLNTNALTNGRVGLLGLNTDLFKNDSLGHGG